MVYDLAKLAEIPQLDDVSVEQARLIVTARFWVSLRKRGIDPTLATSQRLGSEAAALRLWMLLEELGAAWPEPFMVSPPCCGRMSHDEALLTRMIDRIGHDDRSGFFALITEMVPVEIADRLYRAARSLADALPEPMVRP